MDELVLDLFCLSVYGLHTCEVSDNEGNHIVPTSFVPNFLWLLVLRSLNL